MKQVFGAVLALALSCASVSAQGRWPKPDWNKIETAVCQDEHVPKDVPIGSYTVHFVLVPATDINDQLCRAYLISPDGSENFLLEELRIAIHQGTGENIFGEGHPGLVVEGYSMGAHCCYTYVIADLGELPVILPSIENEVPFFFFKDTDGDFKILTSDGSFDYFDGMCHACTAFPTVVLQLKDRRLQNVSPEFTPEYDAEIAEARSHISQEALGRFLTVPDLSEESESRPTTEELRKQILEVVLGYLYSGREARGWQELGELWPASDRDRVKRVILEAVGDGILSKLSNPAVTQLSTAAGKQD